MSLQLLLHIKHSSILVFMSLCCTAQEVLQDFH